MGGPRLYAALLAAVLVSAAGCSADESTRSPAPAPSASSAATPTASVVGAWQATDVRVRPDWVGRDAPWVWQYSDDVVVIGPRELVALDREAGTEVWRLKLGGRVCGATSDPSELGLVAVAVGNCRPDLEPTRGGIGFPTGGPATARRTTVKGIDLESASVVWERPFVGTPTLEVGGEVLLATVGCAARRIDLTTGSALGRLDLGCEDGGVAGQGLVVVRSPGEDRDWRAPVGWRVIDIATGKTRHSSTGPGWITEPRRIVAGDPLTVIAGSARKSYPNLVRIDEEGVRVLSSSPASQSERRTFATIRDDQLVLAADTWAGVTVFALEDGSVVRRIRYRDADTWIPIAALDAGLLGLDGDLEGLSSGHGRLTMTNLVDSSVSVLGEFGEFGELSGEDWIGDTNYTVAGPKAVVIDDVLLMPTHGNQGVMAHQLILPADE